LWLTPKSVNKNSLAIIPSTNEKRREPNGGISDRKLIMNKEIRAIKETAVLVELKLKALDFHVTFINSPGTITNVPTWPDHRTWSTKTSNSFYFIGIKNFYYYY
jgi:hypothetical protein